MGILKLTELYVGKWYNYKGNDVILTADDIGEAEHGNLLNIITPTLLTDAWLEKLGYKRVNDLSYTKVILDRVLHIFVIIGVDRYIVSLSGPFGMVQVPSKQYVHELQILESSLTKK